jgi:hypothetical protein
MNYEPEVVVQAFVRFNPDRTFELQDIVDFDDSLSAANDTFIIAALQAEGFQTPSRFDKSRVIQYAVVSSGDFGPALIAAASVYRHAIDVGVIR